MTEFAYRRVPIEIVLALCSELWRSLLCSVLFPPLSLILLAAREGPDEREGRISLCRGEV